MSRAASGRGFDLPRRVLLAVGSSAMAGLAWAGAAPQGNRSRLKRVPLRDVSRVDRAADEGWLARDRHGALWHVAVDAAPRLVGHGVQPDGPLAAGHGRIAGRGEDGRLWVREVNAASQEPERSSERLAPNGGLCVLRDAVVGIVEQAGRSALARFEPDASRRWHATSRSDIEVLPDAEPVVVDLDGRGDGGHVAVLAGPDRHRYPHAVLGDDVEATRVLWLDRNTLAPMRMITLDAPEVFEDRRLRPWRWANGRTGLVTIRSGPQGAQLAVIAASTREASALEIAATGPFIGQRNRWLSPASVTEDAAEVWAVHTPHIGGVLHRYRPEGDRLLTERLTRGVTNHRMGERELDVSARTGRWLVLPDLSWHAFAIIDLQTYAVAGSVQTASAVVQLVTGTRSAEVAILTTTRLEVWHPA